MSVTWRRRTGLFMTGMLWTLLVLTAGYKLRLMYAPWWEQFGGGMGSTIVCRQLYRWWIS